MNKDELLQELQAKITAGEIQSSEVLSVLNHSAVGAVVPAIVETEHTSVFSLTKMLYVLGAAIIIIGIIIFVQQIWIDIGSFGRVSLTLGLGMLFTGLGSVLLSSHADKNLGNVFHLIGGLLVPGGSLVLVYEIYGEASTLWPVVVAFGLISVFYLLLNLSHKTAVLTLFTIFNCTCFVYVLTAAILEDSYSAVDDVFAYLTILIGVCYLILTHFHTDLWDKRLIGALHFFGITGILGGAFSQVFDSGAWEMLYFIVVTAGFLLAVYMKSRTILIMSSIFLIAHVSYITSQYFADSIGWPITLVLLGFMFIGLGFGSININKKYIASNN